MRLFKLLFLIFFLIINSSLNSEAQNNNIPNHELVISKILVHHMDVELFQDSLYSNKNKKRILTLDSKKHNDFEIFWDLVEDGKLITDTIHNFAFRLAGFDKDWIYQEKQNNTRYTNLKPGRYTFMVRYSENNIWSNETTEQQLIIKPQFHQTWAAKIIFLGIIITTFLVIKN